MRAWSVFAATTVGVALAISGCSNQHQEQVDITKTFTDFNGSSDLPLVGKSLKDARPEIGSKLVSVTDFSSPVLGRLTDFDMRNEASWTVVADCANVVLEGIAGIRMVGVVPTVEMTSEIAANAANGVYQSWFPIDPGEEGNC